MNSISVKKICEVTGGTLLNTGSEEEIQNLLLTEINKVILNSKETVPGSLFVPIIGEKTDAHDYIADAYNNGARVTFTSRDIIPSGTEGMAFIRVNDTKDALQALGAYYRSCFKGKVIGITGSVGKTTTKEMVAAALSAGSKVLKTSGNRNSQLGVPLMMFELTDEFDTAVFEMGMSEFGEMERLAKVASPKWAVMTNIGVAHIAQLHTQENIRSEKLKITDSFDAEGGKLFINGEDELLLGVRPILPKDKKIDVITFGLSDKCDYYADGILTIGETTEFDFRVTATGESEHVSIPVIGKHNVIDAVVAMAVAKEMGIEPVKSGKMLGVYSPMNMRGRIENINGVILIDDTYNASPDSMRSGLDMVSGMNVNGRKTVVFADVLELGEFSAKCHFDVGEYAASKKIDRLVTIGAEARHIAEGAVKDGAAFDVCSYDSRDGVYENELKKLKAGDVVYMKGSRGMRLDLLAQELRDSLK